MPNRTTIPTDRSVEPAVRLVVGELDSEGVAAVTAVLFALAAAADPNPRSRRLAARWNRPERATTYCSPRSWR